MLSNATVKHINKLQQKKYRREYNEFIIEGVKGVGELLNSKLKDCIVMIIIQKSIKEESQISEIWQKAEKEGIEVNFCDNKEIGKIKTTSTFPGVMAVGRQKNFSIKKGI